MHGQGEYTQPQQSAAQGQRAILLPWGRIDTVLLDMDGTVLDLAYDNYFWRNALPQEYARVHGLEAAQARSRLFARMAAVAGTLEWYCLDYWSRELSLNVRALKRALAGRIAWLPAAREFLLALRSMNKRLVLVTNAHRDTLALKLEHTDLANLVDGLYSAHDFRQAKERAEFWPRLHAVEGFDPRRTLLVEDNLEVLGAAQAFGLELLVAVSQPDSTQPPRSIVGFPAVRAIAELLPAD